MYIYINIIFANICNHLDKIFKPDFLFIYLNSVQALGIPSTNQTSHCHLNSLTTATPGKVAISSRQG